MSETGLMRDLVALIQSRLSVRGVFDPTGRDRCVLPLLAVRFYFVDTVMEKITGVKVRH